MGCAHVCACVSLPHVFMGEGGGMCTSVHVHECHCHMYLLVCEHVTVTQSKTRRR